MKNRSSNDYIMHASAQNHKQGEIMERTAKEQNEKILKVYEEYLKSLKTNAPELLDKNNFSAIFCTGVPTAELGFPIDWDKATNRILIIGQEAWWGKSEGEVFSSFKNVQEWVLKFERCQLYETNWPYSMYINNNQYKQYDKNTRCFWAKFRKVASCCDRTDTAFCYANIDAICDCHTGADKGKMNKYRKQLHANEIYKIMREVIEIIDPTIVIFFGWHDLSLHHEIPELIDGNPKLYPNGKWNTQNFQQMNRVYEQTIDKRKYFMTYHPRCWGKCTDQILEKIRKSLRQPN